MLVQNHIDRIEGATVLDVSGALMKMAELMIVLGEVSGTRISRRGFYEAPERSTLESVIRLYQRESSEGN